MVAAVTVQANDKVDNTHSTISKLLGQVRQAKQNLAQVDCMAKISYDESGMPVQQTLESDTYDLLTILGFNHDNTQTNWFDPATPTEQSNAWEYTGLLEQQITAFKTKADGLMTHINADLDEIKADVYVELESLKDSMINPTSDNNLLKLKSEYDKVNTDNISILQETYQRIKYMNSRIKVIEEALGVGYIEDVG